MATSSILRRTVRLLRAFQGGGAVLRHTRFDAIVYVFKALVTMSRARFS
jgi:hypothetical protein